MRPYSISSQRLVSNWIVDLTKQGYGLNIFPGVGGIILVCFLTLFPCHPNPSPDVGTSSLLAVQAIKLARGSVSHLTPHHIHLSDTSLPADEIVFATGYLNMRDTARKIFGDELANRVGDVWGFDEEGEVRVCTIG